MADANSLLRLLEVSSGPTIAVHQSPIGQYASLDSSSSSPNRATPTVPLEAFPRAAGFLTPSSAVPSLVIPAPRPRRPPREVVVHSHALTAPRWPSRQLSLRGLWGSGSVEAGAGDKFYPVKLVEFIGAGAGNSIRGSGRGRKLSPRPAPPVATLTPDRFTR